MAQVKDKYLDVKSLVRRKVKTTYEYIPIIGQILGYWRTEETECMGDKIELHIKASLENYDRLFINGKEIEIPRDLN